MDRYDPGPLPTNLSHGSWSGLNAALTRLSQAETARETEKIRQLQLTEETARRRNQSNRNKAAKEERNRQKAAETAAAKKAEEERIRQEQYEAKETTRIKREQEEKSAQMAAIKVQEEEKLLANAAAKAKEEKRAEIAERVRLAKIQQAKEEEERKSRITVPSINPLFLERLDDFNRDANYTTNELKMLKEYKVILHFNQHYGSFNKDLIQQSTVPRFLNPDMLEQYYFLYLRIASPINLIALYRALTKYNKGRAETDNFNIALSLIKTILAQDSSDIERIVNAGDINKDTMDSIGSILHLTPTEQTLYDAFVASEPDNTTTFTKEEAMKMFIISLMAESKLPGLLVLYNILYKTNNFSKGSPYYKQYMIVGMSIKIMENSAVSSAISNPNKRKTRKNRKSRARRNR